MTDPKPFPPRSSLRREDRRFVTGVGRYVADVAPAGTLSTAFVRSVEAHASIRGVDTSDARGMAGVVGVFTAEDLGLPDLPGDGLAVKAPDFPRPHLASDRVRYVGEPIAVVVAESSVLAVDAAERVWVEYDPMPVSDPAAALGAAILIHQRAGTNIVERWELGDPVETAEHEVSVEVELENQRLAPTAIEPLAILAQPGEDGRLTIHIGHQRPHELRAKLAGLLGMDQGLLRVVVPDVGGAFGMKGMTYPEHTVVAALALELGRPVIWLERRREHMSGGTHGRGSTHRVRLAGRADGRIERAEVHIVADVGAYPHNGTSIPSFSRYLATGPYDIPDVWVTSTSVVTNRAPTGSYRGAGRPEAAYGLERAIDAYARAAGLDPIQVRLANFIPSAALPFRTPTGALYDSGDYAAALQLAVELIELDKVRAEQQERLARGDNPIGVGFGAFIERAGGRVDTGEFGRVEMDGNGQVTVWTGSTSAGQGHETVWAQVAAEALAVPIEDVVLVAGDTDRVERGSGTSASRSTQIGAAAVWRTAHAVQDKGLQVAAAMLEASVEDLILEDGVFAVAGVPGSGVTWARVAAAAGDMGVELAADEWYVPGAQTFPYGVHAAVVEVGLETGEVRILKLAAVDDCGHVLNPMLVEGQIQGSLVQGIGQAMYEKIEYSEDGQLRTASLMDYELPRAGDIPPIVTGRLVHPAPSNPLGAKGTGEAGCIGAPPAIVNAVLDALAPYGVTHLDMPLRPATVWAALRAAAEGGMAISDADPGTR